VQPAVASCGSFDSRTAPARVPALSAQSWVVAVSVALFRLWHLGTAVSTPGAWLLGAAGIVVILLGAVIL
jgi:hypothetical protein